MGEKKVLRRTRAPARSGPIRVTGGCPGCISATIKLQRNTAGVPLVTPLRLGHLGPKSWVALFHTGVAQSLSLGPNPRQIKKTIWASWASRHPKHAQETSAYVMILEIVILLGN